MPLLLMKASQRTSDKKVHRRRSDTMDNGIGDTLQNLDERDVVPPLLCQGAEDQCREVCEGAARRSEEPKE
jgi:hypothetical protein